MDGEIYPQKWLRKLFTIPQHYLPFGLGLSFADRFSHVSRGSNLNVTNEGKILEPEPNFGFRGRGNAL
jgi:hypothetical protein